MSERAVLEAVLRVALDAVNGERCVRAALASERVGGPVHVVAAGKAACAMARGAVAALGSRVRAGVAVTKDGHASQVPGIDVIEAAHPVPDERGVAAAERVLAEVAALEAESDLLVLLSGGASALLVAPANGVALADKLEVTRQMLRAGADIESLNTVRKHLSRLKGGGLARVAAERRVLALAISDVPDDRIDLIGSGPTAPDPSTYADALDALARHGVDAPPAVLAHLREGAAGRRAETPGPGDRLFARFEHRVVARLEDALAEAVRAGAERGLEPLLLGRTLRGDARDCAAALALRARSERGRRRLLVAGGEPTVRVRGAGRGGRAQELALAFALQVEDEPGIAGLFCGTDGTDGPTDAAGAFADGTTAGRARSLGLDPRDHLERNDSYPLLGATGDRIVTGPTGTNVTDLALVALG